MGLGILSGISVGPGDPELITVKGLRLLQGAPVVAFPAGREGQAGIAEQIVAQWLRPAQVKLPLFFSFVQDDIALMTAWQSAARDLGYYLTQGQDVVFVCEGDISFYSTFTYLAQTVQAEWPDIEIRRVPGVCSPMAGASALGFPLTVRNQRLVVLPALYHLQELEAALNWADVVVLMKVNSVYEQVWAILARWGLLAQTSVIERATLPNQVIYHGLEGHPQLKLSYFSLIIIQVANFVTGSEE